MPILLKLFQKTADEGTLSKLILQGHHNHYTKTRQRQHKKRKLQVNITDEHRCKNPKILANGIQQQIKKLIHHDQAGFDPGLQGCRILQYMQINQCDIPY